MSWYVMHSKPNKEELLYEQLRFREIDVYYPRLRVSPANPRARKRKPYFPGYLFVRADLDALAASALKWMPGAQGLVDFGNDPASVPDELLRAIQERVDQMNTSFVEKHAEAFQSGEIVTIQSGPFAGYQAMFDSSLPGQDRVRVLLRLLSDRQVSLELSAKQLTH